MLAETVRTLGDLLGQVIRIQAGDHVLETEEEIRGLSKQWRSGDESANSKIAAIVSKVVDDLPLTAEILKAFSTFFRLVNLAEEHERIRVLDQRADQAFVDDVPMDESLWAALGTLEREGVTATQVEQMLERMLVTPVFTAHPTESRRRITLKTVEHLSETLGQLQSVGRKSHRFPDLEEELRDTVMLLWQCDERRQRKPTVMDELRNTGLFFFEDTLFDVVPKVYEELERALERTFPDIKSPPPCLLRFGSWIGGDRDGNPFVKLKTTEEAIRAQKNCVISRYMQDVEELYASLAISIGRASFNDVFVQALESELKSLDPVECEELQRFNQEPYRQKMILIFRRLAATQEQNRLSWADAGDSADATRGYATPSELETDLQLIVESLKDNKGASIVRGKLSRLVRRVQVFGFHLASLDIRQHSGRHESAIAEILKRYSIADDYAGLAEEEKVRILQDEIAGKRPLTSQLTFSEDSNESVGLFHLVGQAHAKAGKQAISSYIISMAESVSDLLEVLLLMSNADLFGQLDIVPLFETIEDLRAAPVIMGKLFDNQVYREHLEQRGNCQQIMIGYSDSNKDGGYLSANWMLFKAQRELAMTCSSRDVELTLFHGRGGSLGRGGGPANRAILAQPAESIRGRLKVTEQGEVISSRYNHNEIASRHLQQLLHAVICSSGTRPELWNLDQWSSIMDEMADLAFAKYRDLVLRPELIEYFQKATPIEHIGQLNLGSRPAKRRATAGIGDLRAIPWVFAWTQSRTGLPSWYGVGSGIKAWVEAQSDSEKAVESLREMYSDWPYFNTLIKNVHVGLGRADLKIGKLYSQLFDESGDSALFGLIEEECRLTQELILQISGHEEILDTEPWLKSSISVRNPYVDPMNYFQVALLEKFRSSTDETEREQIQDLILQSISGIAAGLQNVG